MVKEMKQEELATAVLQIPSLRCGGCLKRVTEALRALPGLEIIATALPDRTVTLRYARAQLESERIAGAVRACGHVPGELSEVSADSGGDGPGGRTLAATDHR
jgi:copper chaperone CopZ